MKGIHTIIPCIHRIIVHLARKSCSFHTPLRIEGHPKTQGSLTSRITQLPEIHKSAYPLATIPQTCFQTQKIW